MAEERAELEAGRVGFLNEATCQGLEALAASADAVLRADAPLDGSPGSLGALDRALGAVVGNPWVGSTQDRERLALIATAYAGEVLRRGLTRGLWVETEAGDRPEGPPELGILFTGRDGLELAEVAGWVRRRLTGGGRPVDRLVAECLEAELGAPVAATPPEPPLWQQNRLAGATIRTATAREIATLEAQALDAAEGEPRLATDPPLDFSLASLGLVDGLLDRLHAELWAGLPEANRLWMETALLAYLGAVLRREQPGAEWIVARHPTGGTEFALRWTQDGVARHADLAGWIAERLHWRRGSVEALVRLALDPAPDEARFWRARLAVPSGAPAQPEAAERFAYQAETLRRLDEMALAFVAPQPTLPVPHDGLPLERASLPGLDRWCGAVGEAVAAGRLSGEGGQALGWMAGAWLGTLLRREGPDRCWVGLEWPDGIAEPALETPGPAEGAGPPALLPVFTWVRRRMQEGSAHSLVEALAALPGPEPAQS